MGQKVYIQSGQERGGLAPGAPGVRVDFKTGRRLGSQQELRTYPRGSGNPGESLGESWVYILERLLVVVFEEMGSGASL